MIFLCFEYITVFKPFLVADKIMPEEMHTFAQGSMFWFTQVGVALPEPGCEGASQFDEAGVVDISNAQFWYAALAHSEEIAGAA